MKQLQEILNEVLGLVNENESFIIFNDGKAVRSNLDQETIISVNQFMTSDEYLKREKSPLEEEINQHAPFVTTISCQKDLDLKIIHICDDETYINYSIILDDEITLHLTNIYYQVVRDVKMKMSIVCKNKSKIHLKSFENFDNNVDLITNMYLYRHTEASVDNLELNHKRAHTRLNAYLLADDARIKIDHVVANATGFEQRFDCQVIHDKPNTTSELTNYGMCKNTSALVLNHIGIIERAAKNTSLSQSTKGIILDLKSSITADPILEINENDVFAKHGASIGAIDENDLYYLMSRGLTREESESLIITAFMKPYFRDIEDKKFLELTTNTVKKMF